MTAEHFDNALTTLADAKPFTMFTIELHGGKRFEIDHPRALVNREGMAVFIAPGGIPILFDHDRVNQIIVAPSNAASE